VGLHRNLVRAVAAVDEPRFSNWTRSVSAIGRTGGRKRAGQRVTPVVGWSAGRGC
jgi:hypothetical protein